MTILLDTLPVVAAHRLGTRRLCAFECNKQRPRSGYRSPVKTKRIATCPLKFIHAAAITLNTSSKYGETGKPYLPIEGVTESPVQSLSGAKTQYAGRGCCGAQNAAVVSAPVFLRDDLQFKLRNSMPRELGISPKTAIKVVEHDPTAPFGPTRRLPTGRGPSAIVQPGLARTWGVRDFGLVSDLPDGGSDFVRGGASQTIYRWCRSHARPGPPALDRLRLRKAQVRLTCMVVFSRVPSTPYCRM